MDDLAWLAGLRFASFVKREYDWILTLESDTRIVIACLWRVIESGRVRLTSSDDGHQFGLPAPINAATEVNQWLVGARIDGVELQKGTLDLHLRFDTGHQVQIIPDSSG